MINVVLLQFFALLFFTMLFVLGVGSAVGIVGSWIQTVREMCPKMKQSHGAYMTCFFGFLFGLVYVTPVSFSNQFLAEKILFISAIPFKNEKNDMILHEEIKLPLRFFYVLFSMQIKSSLRLHYIVSRALIIHIYT